MKIQYFLKCVFIIEESVADTLVAFEILVSYDSMGKGTLKVL